MKITIYSTKGSAGKTPIALNMAFDRGYGVATNEIYHILGSVLPEEQMLAVKPDEAFPELPDEIDMVFDLGGYIEGGSASILSALRQSDVVLVPVFNTFQAINGGYNTIREVREHNPNIVIIATKLERKDKYSGQWERGEDFVNIRDRLFGLLEAEYPIFPLKASKGFDAIIDHEKSLRQLVAEGGLNGYAYREPAQQFDAIYQYLDTHHG